MPTGYSASANLSSATGVLSVVNGGTGVSNLTANKVLIGNGTGGVTTPPTLHWDGSRLGVNMSSPTHTLDVVGNIRAASSYGILTLQNNSGINTQSTYMNFYNSDSTARAIIGQDGNGLLTTAPGALLLSTWTDHPIILAANGSSGSSSEKMRITSSGNVGIGKTNPSYALDVAGDINFTGTLRQNGTAFSGGSGGGGGSVAAQACFNVYQTNSSQLTSGLAKINFQNVEFNVGNIWNTATGRFQPTIAGYYQLSWVVTCNAVPNQVEFASILFKGNTSTNVNGTWYCFGNDNATVSAIYSASVGSVTVYMNGSTDWCEVRAGGQNNNNLTLSPINAPSRFSGSLISGVTLPVPVSSGGTGLSNLTANKLLVGNGSNNISAASLLHWDGSKLGVGTSAPVTALDINGTINSTAPIFGMAFQGFNSAMGPADFTHIALGKSASFSNAMVFKYTHVGDGSGANMAQWGVWGSNNITAMANGNVGIGTASPSTALEVRNDTSPFGTVVKVTNSNSSGFSAFQCTADFGGGLVMYQNDSTRTTDGSAYMATVRNDVGDLRLCGKNSVQMIAKTSAGIQITDNNAVALAKNTGSPLYVLDMRVGNSQLQSWVKGDCHVAALFSDNPYGSGWGGAQTTFWVTRDASTGRSINAAGTVNANGADYAEYMYKQNASDMISKGSIIGVTSNNMLTKVFDESTMFLVKSTNPSFVGGDDWGIMDGSNLTFPDSNDPEFEALRAKVDRIAFCGQVPVNVFNANPGDYVVPVREENGGISAVAVSASAITFDQYRMTVGRVTKVLDDGRAQIIVKCI